MCAAPDRVMRPTGSGIVIQKRVFISYSSADRAVADTYRGALEEVGIACWIAPRDVPPGLKYAQAIVQAISACEVFLLVFSVRSNASVQVGNEIERAASKDKPIFLIRTDETDPHDNDQISLFLASHHWFDATEGETAECLSRLVESIEGLLDSGAVTSDLPASPSLVRSDRGEPAVAVIEAARSFEWSGDWDVAEERYRGLLNSRDERVKCLARIRLARCLIETSNRGETDEAEDLLDEAARMAITENDQLILGELRLQQGRLDDVGAHLKNALERYEEARSLLAAGSVDLTEIDLVLTSAERRRGEFNKALARVTAIDSDALPPRLRAEYFDELGATLVARGEARAAIAVLEKGLALDDATGTAYAGSRSKLLLAEACMRTGAPDQAFELIEEAIATYRRLDATAGLSEAYALMGTWYEDREDYSAAIHYFLDSYELDRTSNDKTGMIRAKRRLARAYRRRGDSNRSRELLADARELLSPDDDVERAAILQEEGHLAISGSDPDYQDAIRLFGAALAIAKDDGDEWTIALAKRNLAAAYRADDDFETAETLLLEAKEAFEKRGDLHELDDLLDDLGELKLESDKYDEAEEYLLASLQLDNQLGRVASKARSLLLLGRVATRKMSQDRAGEYFEQARDLYERARDDVGLADALKDLGAWHLNQGQIDPAIKCLQEALEIDSRLDRPLGRVHAKRWLAASMRQRGNLARAAEYLTEARKDLHDIDDPLEHAALDLEEGRIELAAGAYDHAKRLLDRARRVFDENNSPVDAASCRRFLALASAYEGRYAEALQLLEEAKVTFEEHNDLLELDELYDDLGSVHLSRGRTGDAAECVQKSLELGQRGTWRRGKGRSLVLLAKIAQETGDRAAARRHLSDALNLYEEIRDEVGQVVAHTELGDWHFEDPAARPGHDEAVSEYKIARRLAQQHQNRRAVARCNRKLALVYIDRGEYQRADEALEDAKAELRDVDDTRDLAPLELTLGKLAAARGHHGDAIDHLRRSLDGFTELSQDDHRNAAYRLLVTSHQACGNVKEALNCLRQMDAERISMYDVLVKDLDPTIANAASASFTAESYSTAIDLAFAALEREFKDRTVALGGQVTSSEGVATHIQVWGEVVPVDGVIFIDRASAQAFAQFCASSFDVMRAMTYKGSDVRTVDAFAALSIAHWIARALKVTAQDRATLDPAEDHVVAV
jgi:tetratricopeptide (TPR) repeat protein